MIKDAVCLVVLAEATAAAAALRHAAPSAAGAAAPASLALAVAEVRPRAVAACTGASTALPADQCAAWQALWDGAGGAGWTRFGAGCTRTDPCDASTCQAGYPSANVCNGAGTTVIGMCVPAPARSPLPRSLRRAAARAPSPLPRAPPPPRAAAAADLRAWPRPPSRHAQPTVWLQPEGHDLAAHRGVRRHHALRRGLQRSV